MLPSVLLIPLLLINLSGDVVQSNQTHLTINNASDKSALDISQWLWFFAGFGGAIGSGLLIKYGETKMSQPDIKIKDVVIVRGFDLTDNGRTVHYYANRIVIENEGKTAAENCKAYIEFSDTDIERTGWMLPDKNAGYTVTLNVDDREYLDLCAMEDNGISRVVTMEHGFTDGKVNSCRQLGNQIVLATLKITSSNASVSKRRIRIYNTSEHFRNEAYRIVEFLD